MGDTNARVDMEAAVELGWERYLCFQGRFVGMHGYSESGKIADVYRKFDITTEAVVRAAREVMAEVYGWPVVQGAILKRQKTADADVLREFYQATALEKLLRTKRMFGPGNNPQAVLLIGFMSLSGRTYPGACVRPAGGSSPAPLRGVRGVVKPKHVRSAACSVSMFRPAAQTGSSDDRF